MSVWMVTTVAVVVVVSLSLGGVVAVGLLIRSIGPLLAEAISNGGSRDRVISLLKRSALLVYALLLLSLLPWSVLLTTAGGMADQYFRNVVDGWMSTPDLFESISIRPDEYAQLPPYWRQALAEIALRPKEESVDVQSVIEGLKVEDIELIDTLAPYMTSFGILRDNSQLSEHPIPELSYNDFSHLEDLGILEDINNGMELHFNKNTASEVTVHLAGSTVQLLFRARSPETENVLEVTAFTRGGKQLIEALRVPSNIAYFEWFGKKLEERGFSVELFSIGIERNNMSEAREIQGRIERGSIPAWPPPGGSAP